MVLFIYQKHFDSSILQDDKNLKLDAYMIRADHPSNTIGEGVCINYEESLSVSKLNI